MSESVALPADPEALLTPEQVSALTQFEVQTLANMRWRKTGPIYLKFGNGRSAPIRYRRRDVFAWLDAQVIAA
ncbi:helix-turn-helix transcriptional regulator [Streptomyces sp. SS]|uniref:helix-turn-helix transcriptional regulator n=1 Tax=Streptomyces sp. SS TaxID=260742 RepID=UPI000567EEDD|nr:helix-turn-helix domain-containing protein [Streptomyces sp. SS]